MKFFLFLILLLNFSVLQLSCTEQKENPEAHLLIDKDTIDIGSILLNEPFVKKVKIQNIGKGKLIINNIKSSCDCTIPSISDSTILPGNHTFFTLKITPKDSGSFDRSVVIESNDKDTYKVIEIRGKVVANKN